jgi:antibiotic biosynthesis monooxygenase (ABM) superfamily enzyme
MSQVHLAITRQVKPGMERAFEDALREFARESLRAPGTTGVHLIGPIPGANSGEYGILRSFESEAACEAFYDSEMFRRWDDNASQFVIGGWTRRRLNGLEAFFQGVRGGPPPKWKMAAVTWLGVFPAVLLWSSLLRTLLIGLPSLLTTAIVSAFVVATLAWIAMPLLTRVFSTWLSPSRINIGD